MSALSGRGACGAPRRGGFRSEGGAVTTMVVFPLAVVSFLLCAHAALVFHGRSVVAAAAQDGLRAAQIENGTGADARQAAAAILDLAPGLKDRDIAVVSEADTITVTVSARLDTVIQGLFSDARSVASGPRERFYGEAERR